MGFNLVGSVGAASQGVSGASVTPAWGAGENRDAGHLLLLFVSVTGTATIPGAIAGWTQDSFAGTSCSVSLYRKLAAGADAAPTVPAVTSGVIAAHLEEWTGQAPSPSDQIGTQAGITSPVTATLAAANAAVGELVVMIGADFRSVARTTSDTWTSNHGTPTARASNDGVSSVNHYSHATLISNSVAAADTAVMTESVTTSITGMAVLAKSFKLNILLPSAIASAEAVGSPTVVAGNVNIQPSSIASAETVSTPRVIARFEAIVRADGAEHHWRLEEGAGTSAADVIGGRTGTYTGSPTLGAAGGLVGDPNTAMTTVRAAPATQYVTVPDDSSLDYGDGPVTFEAVINWANTTAGVDHYILSKGTGAPSMFVGTGPNGTVYFESYGASQEVASTVTLTSGIYYHIVGTKETTSTQFVCGAECGLTSVQAGHWDTVFGTGLTIDTATVQPGGGSRSYKFIGNGSAAGLGHTLGQTSLADRFYFNFAALPGAGQVQVICDYPNANGSAFIKVTGAGNVRLRLGGSAADVQIGPTGAITPNTWHYVDVYFDCSTGTAVLKARLDGGTESSDTHAQVSANIQSVRRGFPDANPGDTGTLFIDQGVTAAASQYPIGRARPVVGTTYLNEVAAAWKVYVNGIDVTNLVSTSAQTASDTTSPFLIASGVAAGGFDGTIDEIAIYRSVLTPDQVFNHWEIIRGGQVLAPTAITSAAAVGSPTLVQGPPPAPSILPTAIASGEAVGSHTLLPGAVTIAPTGIASAEAVGSHTLKATSNILPTAINPGEAVGSHTLLPGSVVISPTGIASGEAVGTPALLLSSVIISPTGISSGEVVGSHTLKATSNILPTAINPGEAVGSPTVIPGSAAILPVGIVSAQSVGTPIIDRVVLPSSINEPGGTGGADGFQVNAFQSDAFQEAGGGSAVGTPTLVVAGTTTTILPTAIASAEAFGTVVVLAGNVNIQPTGIASGEALGTPVVVHGNANILPTAIPSAEAFGTFAVLPGNVNIQPTGIASAEAVGTPVVVHGNVNIQPTSIASAEAFGTFVVLATANILPTAIPTGEVLGTPSLIAGNVNILPTGIASAEAVGTPVVRATATILPGAIASAEVVNNPIVLAGNVNILPTSIASGESVGTPILTQGAGVQFILPSAIGPGEALGTPIIVRTLAPTAIPSGEALGTPVVVAGQVLILPGSIPTGESVGVPSLITGAGQILPTAIPSAEAVGTPTLIPGAVRILPTAVASGEALGTPVLTGNANILPTGIGSAEAVGTPTLLHGVATILPSSIPSAEAVGPPALIASARILPTAIASGEAVGNPTLLPGNVNILPGGIPSGEAVGTPSLVLAAGQILPTAIPSAETVGTPTVIAGTARILPSAIPGAEVVNTPLIGRFILPTAIPSGEASGSQTVRPGGVTISPTSVGSQEALGTPSIVVGGRVVLPSGITSGEILGLPTLVVQINIQPESIAPAAALGFPRLIPGTVIIYPGGIPSGEVIGDLHLSGQRISWRFVNRTPNWRTAGPVGDTQVQDKFGRPSTTGGVAVQDKFGRPKRREGE